MANNRTLTSSTAIIMLQVDTIFPVPVRLQGFSADDVFDTDAVTPGETSMGVDGRLSAGFVPYSVRQNITLQADSLSNDLFEQWLSYERQISEKLVATGSVILLSTQRRYAMTRGFLMSAPVTPAARKILQPRRFTIEWEKVEPALSL